MILGRRPEPHWPGHRVRLLLRARELRACRRRLRDHHGQLQPRDGLHRLRHLRQALFRAAHLRGRDGHRRCGRPRRRRRDTRRPDAAQAGRALCRKRASPLWARAPRRSTWPRTATVSPQLLDELEIDLPRSGPWPLLSKRPHRVAERHRLPAARAVRATCSVAAAWPSSTTTTQLDTLHGRGRRRSRLTTRSILIDSSKLPLKSTSMRSATARTCSWAASWSTSRWQASTRATRPAARRRSRSRSAFRGSCATSHAALALRLGVVGLLNIQFAIKDQVIYVIEANPRASRTVPFVSKATGVPLAKIAARIMAGEKLADLHLPADDREFDYFCVKEAVMPFGRFPGSDVVLGPEMKSTGEVMGIAGNFPAAFTKTQLAIDYEPPRGGEVFISVNDGDKRNITGDRSLHRAPRVLARCNDGHCPRPSRVGHRMRRGWQDPRRLAHDSRPYRIGQDRAHDQHAVRQLHQYRRLRDARAHACATA